MWSLEERRSLEEDLVQEEGIVAGTNGRLLQRIGLEGLLQYKIADEVFLRLYVIGERGWSQ